ncbi:hypothetical protein FPV16_07945 [Methylobacterium sp. W2]|nr:hypothetical protein [Methylobacterium sp. W2]
MSLKQLLEMLKTNPMDSLIHCRDQYQASTNERNRTVYETVGYLTGFVADVNSSKKLKDELYGHVCWKNGYKPKATEVTRTSVRFVMKNFDTRHRDYEKARSYAKVIDYHLAKGTDPETVADRLEGQKLAGVLESIKDEGRLAKFDQLGNGSDGLEEPGSLPKASDQGDDRVSVPEKKGQPVTSDSDDNDDDNDAVSGHGPTGTDNENVVMEPESYVVIEGERYPFDPNRQLIVDTDDATRQIVRWHRRGAMPYYLENRGYKNGLTVIGAVGPDWEDDDEG